ncbi:hypothetical protein GCM10009613_35850 [Pseudonocardia kongjuensis]|uniref:Uncharacterized protein n=1 Tax=Pseudonocardia kongjuensis TaxID=102227 RepID=A0ABN1XWQ0_9PSEU
MTAPRPVRLEDLDERLVAVSGRTARLQVLIDHDDVGAGRCPTCGWTCQSRTRACPSRTAARALLDRCPFPAWLAHLADRVPGARTAAPSVSDEERRAAEDALDGLFPAPQRVPARRTR